MRNKSRQIMIIAVLVIGVIGLSVGFAAFSSTLNINSTARVNPNASDFSLVFANNTDVSHLDISDVSPSNNSTGTGPDAVINNQAQGGPKLTGLGAVFTAPGQFVEYDLYIVNNGHFDAYLTDLVFNNVEGGSSPKTCDKVTEGYGQSQLATDGSLASVCDSISVSVEIDNQTYTSTSDLNNLKIDKGSNKQIKVIVTYTGSTRADGPMRIRLGSISINAATVGTQNQGGGETPSEPQSSNVELPDYVVNEQGQITKYNGAGGNITIPSTLPVYVESEYEYVKLADCISLAVHHASMDQATATSVCTQVKEDVESGKITDSDGASVYTQQFYSSLKPGAIVKGYEATGNSVTVTSIGYAAFMVSHLTSVTIPNSVITIGEGAFYGNNITSVTIPDSVIVIGRAAFNANKLTSVTLGSGITTIGEDAFGSGINLTDDINYGPNVITSITINALKSNVSSNGTSVFGYDSNANCEDTVVNDWKSNSCINWING